MFRKSIVFFLGLGLVISLTGRISLAALLGSDAWYQNQAGYREAVRNQKAGESLLLYFYAPWCPYCKQFEEKVLRQPEVQKALAGVTKVRIDVPREKALAAQFGVQGFPAVFVVRDGSSNPKKVSAYPNPGHFLRECRKAGLFPESDAS